MCQRKMGETKKIAFVKMANKLLRCITSARLRTKADTKAQKARESGIAVRIVRLPGGPFENIRIA